MNLTVFEKLCAAEGASEDLPDAMGWNGIVEGSEHLVIEDHEVCKRRRLYDPIEAQPTVLSGTGETGAGGVGAAIPSSSDTEGSRFGACSSNGRLLPQPVSYALGYSGHAPQHHTEPRATEEHEHS